MTYEVRKQRCKAKTAAGKRCKGWASFDGLCGSHEMQKFRLEEAVATFNGNLDPVEPDDILPSVHLEKKNLDTHEIGKKIVDFLQAVGVFEGKNGQLAYAVMNDPAYPNPRWYQTVERLVREGVIEGSGSRTFTYSGGGTRYFWRMAPEFKRPGLEGVTTQLDDSGYEQLVVYVQNLKDENEKLKMEVKALRRMFGQMMDMFGR